MVWSPARLAADEVGLTGHFPRLCTGIAPRCPVGVPEFLYVSGGIGTVGRVLAGRATERAAIAAVLDASRAGTGGALVLRGVAGSGKSTLLADALAAASDMTVLRTSGVESESPLAFAALQRLLWPVRSRIDALPAPQRGSLRAAMGEAEGEGDRYLAFLGTLSLLADAAEKSPVLAVVDDATGSTTPRRRRCCSPPAGCRRSGSRCCTPPATATPAASTPRTGPPSSWAG